MLVQLSVSIFLCVFYSYHFAFLPLFCSDLSTCYLDIIQNVVKAPRTAAQLQIADNLPHTDNLRGSTPRAPAGRRAEAFFIALALH